MDILTDLLVKNGAGLVGYADLGKIPALVRGGMPSGVSIAVALNPRIVAGIVDGPTREYYDEYVRVNGLLDDLGAMAVELLHECGYEASSTPTNRIIVDPLTYTSQLPHKTVATRAGLGWIGKSALLVTEQYGSAVRLATVLTNAAFHTGVPVDESHCGDCMVCVDACPARAASGAAWRAGTPRDTMLDAHLCRSTAVEASARRFGVDASLCGVCMAVCPWTQRYIARATSV